MHSALTLGYKFQLRHPSSDKIKLWLFPSCIVTTQRSKVSEVLVVVVTAGRNMHVLIRSRAHCEILEAAEE